MKKIILIIFLASLMSSLLVCCTNKATDGALDAASDGISEKIADMTLKDKIEQLLILDCSVVSDAKEGEKEAGALSDDTKKAIEQHTFGGIILFGDNLRGTKQTFELVKSLQLAATEDNIKHKIPLFICVDQEGGLVTRLATGTSLPGNMALGAIDDYETTKDYAALIANELSALGFNVDFAPVLDINSNPANPIIGVRSFSSDKDRVARMGKAFVEGLQSQGVASTLKHFPGHGDTATDSHSLLPMINKTYDEIKSCELIPFKAGIDQGADMIMTSHIVYPHIETTTYRSKKTGEEIPLPATLSKTILTDILRHDLGFDGLIVTDALNMAAISLHFDQKDVAKYALNAGADLLLMPVSLACEDGAVDAYVEMIVDLVESGEVLEATIDTAVSRILKQKQTMGMLNEASMKFTQDDLSEALRVVGSREHHVTELEIAKDAVTLIKGQDRLPLDGHETLLFFNAVKNGENSIHYAIQCLKEKALKDDACSYEIAEVNESNISALKGQISNASKVIILADTVKNTSFNNNAGDGSQGRFIDEAIKEAQRQGKDCVLISCMLPYDAERYKDADVILCAYLDKTIPSLPTEYHGETPTYGVNISAAIIKLFTKEEFRATLPVDLYKLDDNYAYTAETTYRVSP